MAIAYYNSYDEEWRAQRKLLTPIFHFSMLEQYAKVFNKQAKVAQINSKFNSIKFFYQCLIILFWLKVFLHRLDVLATAGGEVDLYPHIIRCTLDIVGGWKEFLQYILHNLCSLWVRAWECYTRLHIFRKHFPSIFLSSFCQHKG